MRYYAQVNGRAFGPFESDSIRDMIRNGGLNRESLVSADKVNWIKAGEVEELFPKPAAPPTPTPSGSGFDIGGGATDDPSKDAVVWYLSLDGKSGTGPYSGRAILSALKNNKASRGSLVWKQGENARTIENDPEFQRWLTPAAPIQPSGPDGFSAPNETPVWYLSFDGRSGMGPYTASQIIQLVEASNASQSALVWKRGENSRRYCEEPTFAAKGFTGADDDLKAIEAEELVKKLNKRFRNAWVCALATVVLPLLVMMLLIALCMALGVGENGAVETARGVGMILGHVAFLLAFAASCASFISTLAFLYAFWKAIPIPFAKTSPGKAIGFLFLPFFNLYWIFVAIYDGATGVNSALKSLASEARARGESLSTVSEGLALAFCITAILGLAPISAIISLILGASMRNAAVQLTQLRSRATTATEPGMGVPPMGPRVVLDDLIK